MGRTVPEFFTTWITSPVWGELVSRMIPRAPAPGAGLAEPAGWRERLAWRRGDRKELVERDLRSLVHQLALLATDEKPEWRSIDPAEGGRAESAVVTTLLSLDAIDIDLALRADLDPERLAELMREAAPDATAELTDDRALALFTKLLDGACLHLVEHFTHLGEFGPRAAVETIRRLGVLDRRLPGPDEKTTTYETAYREGIVALYGDVRLHGLGLPLREQTYELATAYVNLSVRAIPDAKPSRSIGRCFEDLLGSYPRLLLEGPAGAGKTTLLQHLTLLVCKGDLPKELASWQKLQVVPFLLRLRTYMRSGGLELPSYEEFVEQELAAGKSDTWVTELLRSGRALVFIDGIDEIPQEFRPRLMTWLDRCIRLHPESRFVLTTRPRALDQAQLEQLTGWKFVFSHLEPMNVTQVNDFIRRWHRTRVEEEGEEVAETLSRRLIDALASRRDLARLATNPLLCAMLCALNQIRNSSLPEGRTALYQAALEMLLEARDREREIPKGTLALSQAQSEHFLSNIAMWMTFNGRRAIDRETALAKIKNLLPRLRHAQTTPEAVFNFLKERSGLLQEPTIDSVEFQHPSFQDYLAATNIFQERNLDHLIQHAHDPLYHDIIIMAVGQSQNDQARQEQILDGLMTRARTASARLESTSPAQALWLLAAACIADVELVSDRLDEVISEYTRKLIPPKTLEEAESLAKAGPFVVDLVADYARTHPLTEHEAAAAIEVVILTGVDDSIPFLERLSRISGGKVEDALARGWFSSRAPEEYAKELLSRRLTSIAFPSYDPDRLQLLHLLANLRGLYLPGIPIADFEPLARLTGLQELRLTNTQVSDLQPLAYLTGLQVLDLESTLVSDLRPLTHFTGLQQLFLAGTPVSDLRPLTCLAHLQVLDLAGSQVSDLRPLAHLTNLQQLKLTNTLVSDLRRLAQLTSLRQLGLAGTRVTDLQPLAHLTELRVLDLANTRVTDLQPLAHLTDLRVLDLTNTQVTDFQSLAHLVGLQIVGI